MVPVLCPALALISHGTPYVGLGASSSTGVSLRLGYCTLQKHQRKQIFSASLESCDPMTHLWDSQYIPRYLPYHYLGIWTWAA